MFALLSQVKFPANIKLIRFFLETKSSVNQGVDVLNNSPSLRWTIYTNFLHLKWLYDKIIMKMSQTLWHDFNISNLSLQYLKYLCTSLAKQICKTKPGHYATGRFVAFLVLSFNWNYRYSSISVVLISAIIDLLRFIILSYFPNLLFFSPLVLLSNLNLQGFCFYGFIFVSPH